MIIKEFTAGYKQLTSSMRQMPPRQFKVQT